MDHDLDAVFAFLSPRHLLRAYMCPVHEMQRAADSHSTSICVFLKDCMTYICTGTA
jgi:hypothetical protein